MSCDSNFFFNEWGHSLSSRGRCQVAAHSRTSPSRSHFVLLLWIVVVGVFSLSLFDISPTCSYIFSLVFSLVLCVLYHVHISSLSLALTRSLYLQTYSLVHIFSLALSLSLPLCDVTIYTAMIARIKHAVHQVHISQPAKQGVVCISKISLWNFVEYSDIFCLKERQNCRCSDSLFFLNAT